MYIQFGEGLLGLAWLQMENGKWKMENCLTSPSPDGEGAVVRELCELYECG